MNVPIALCNEQILAERGALHGRTALFFRGEVMARSELPFRALSRSMAWQNRSL